MKARSVSSGVPIKSNIDSSTSPSVEGRPSASKTTFFGLSGKQWLPENICSVRLRFSPSIISWGF